MSTWEGRLGVAGWPVGHSLSPLLHNAALAAFSLPFRYQLLPLPSPLFAQTVRALPALSFRGINVTIPHKEAALRLAARASGEARAIGAANTLCFLADGTTEAHNTDGRGVVAALERRFGTGFVAGKRVLILGGGGSARAVLYGLRQAGAAALYIWTRRPEQGQALAVSLGAVWVRRLAPADLLVNCTPVGLQQAAAMPIEQSATPWGPLNQLGLTLDQLHRYPYVLDLVYGKRETPLCAAARRAGANALDGRAVLVCQAALSFALWFGVDPPFAQMEAALPGDG